MKSFEVRRTIAAPPQDIWDILTDAGKLQGSELGITRIEGTIAPDATIQLWSEVSPARAFWLRVSEWTPPSRMVWTGGMPLGLFTGRRLFSLRDADGATEFHMREEFSGLFASLIAPSIPDLQPSFEKFADGVKRMAEGVDP